jgi:sigma-B regulation protein RsbU (phosphoserine phosphatase)
LLPSSTRVLVVDDDPDVRQLLTLRLRAWGYGVDAAADGDEALARVAAWQPDLLFLDISMPGRDGLTVLDDLRGARLDLAVVMTTAFGSEGVAIEALRRGADDYLRKPFEPAELQAVLARTVERLELSRQNAALRRQLDEKHRQLEAELARAARIQAELLPLTPPRMAGFELAARCLPAREVGGDFYDWQQPACDCVTLTVGDVMGKGVSAALLMATARATLRAVAVQNQPAVSLELANRALEADLERSGSYLTVFHAQLEVTSRRLTYVDAGHGHAVLRRKDGRAEALASGGFPLGISGDARYREARVEFDRGDALLVYSDGLVDAHAEARLDRQAVADGVGATASADEAVARMVELVDASEALPDDLTLMVLRCR